MIRLLYAELAALPTIEEMEKEIPSTFCKGYFDAHEKASRAGLGGLWLAARAGACGELRYDEKGRPRMIGGNYADLSISHTGNFVFCALVDGEHRRIGLDAEDGGRVATEAMGKIARRFFTPEEQAFLADAPDLREAFLVLWTKKEAYAKYCGEGLSALFAGKLPEGETHFSTGKIEGLRVAICTDAPLQQGFPRPEKVDSLVKNG